MTITGKSRSWELKNSLWVLLSFIPVFYFSSFFYISNRIPKKIYKVFAYSYLALSLGCIFGAFGIHIYDLLILGMFLQIIVIIQCLVIRGEYLRALAKMEDERMVETAMQTQQMNQNYGASFQSMPMNSAFASSLPENMPFSSAVPSVKTENQKININICPEEEICSLPGINVIDAKKAVLYREQNGGFQTVEEFINCIGIKPHLAAQIVERVDIMSDNELKSSDKDKTRLLDI